MDQPRMVQRLLKLLRLQSQQSLLLFLSQLQMERRYIDFLLLSYIISMPPQIAWPDKEVWDYLQFHMQKEETAAATDTEGGKIVYKDPAEAELAKKKARAARFGVPLSLPEDKKMDMRAQRCHTRAHAIHLRCAMHFLILLLIHLQGYCITLDCSTCFKDWKNAACNRRCCCWQVWAGG